MPLPSLNARIHPLAMAPGFAVDVLRLDEIHPEISGNKWFKLQGYINEARSGKKTTLRTFGGAYSNHLVATAAAAKLYGFRSIGLVRGEAPRQPSHTLVRATELGMELQFLSRTDYRKQASAHPNNEGAVYTIPEGGFGELGAQGAMGILQALNSNRYTHIVTAVGTGTTLAGLVRSAATTQTVVGISVLKNAMSLQQAVNELLQPQQQNRFALLHDYHFGGYAKATAELFTFMNNLYRHGNVPTDFVYTAKAFFAAQHLFRTGWLTPNDKVLLVHTGGLQGNRSLPKGTLIFEG